MKIKTFLLPGKSVVAAGVLSLIVLAGCENNLDEPAAILGESSSSDAAAQAQNHVANELLVKFKKGTSETTRATALARISGKVKEHILTKAMQGAGDEGIYLVHTPMAALDAIAKAKGVEVEYAEPNWIYQHQAITSDDTHYTNGSLWGMYGPAAQYTDGPKNQFGSQADVAWAANHTGVSSVYIGIIDEGYMYTHEDLASNAGTNPGEDGKTAGVDDDKNGLVDDVYGWDFVNGDNSVFDGTSDDHGTHVAGTIGGVGGNSKGVAGVVWNVKLLNAKFLGANGGTTANAIKAVDYFTTLKKGGLNIVATNNSWGGGGFSQELYNAIERANQAGILFIAAAGNGGMDGRGDDLDSKRGASYPASYSNANIITVAALSSSGAKATYSNYGAKSVDLGAPGSGIYSTLPDNKYGSYSGTSMATPHVTGAAALYAAYNPGSNAAAIKSAIMSSALPTASLNGKCVSNGRLNVSGF